jgi:hypothetical protein
VRSETLPIVHNTTNLFHHDSLSDYLSKQRDYAKQAIGEIRTLEDLSAKELELRRTYRVAVPTLRRRQARFEINDMADGIAARITVPFQGDAQLFSAKPDDSSHRGIGPQATIDDGRWSNDGPAISLAKTFDPATTADEVKIWAKSEIDNIEAWLSDMSPEVDTYNRTVDAFIGSLVEQRRRVLATAESLRAELKDGI